MALTQYQEEVAGWFTVQNTLKRTSKLIKDSGILSDEDTFKWDKPSIADIRGILSNEFKGTTLLDFIIFNYSNRFNEVSPYDFEDFICFLVLAKGYSGAKVTSSSSDYGVDITCETLENEEFIKTAIQVKRYAESNKVGVKDLNQLLGGKDYYECQRTIMVTTSDLTKNAWELAEKTGTEVWTWEEIDSYIQHFILLDHPYHDFKEIQIQEEKSLVAQIARIEQNIETGEGLCVRITFKLENKGTNPINVLGVSSDSCLIKSSGLQINNVIYDNDSFQKGMIYPKGFTELALFIPKDKAKSFGNGDRFILVLLGTSQDFSYDLNVNSDHSSPGIDKYEEVISKKTLIWIAIFIGALILLSLFRKFTSETEIYNLFDS